MTTTTKEMLEKILEDLKAAGGVEASAVVSRDGLPMVGDVPEDVYEKTFAAMNATIIKAAETAVSELGRGPVKRVIVEGDNTRIIGSGAGKNSIVIVMTRPTSGLGLLLMEMDKAADRVKKIMG